jgi:hypothetical protein
MRSRRNIFGALVIGLAIAAVAPAYAMTGDADALALARRMIENMGGREAWANARWLYAREEAHYANRASPADAQFWRRLDAPGGRWRIRATGYSRDVVWNQGAGYRVIDGAHAEFSATDLQQEVGWWRGDIYTMYSRLAREDEGLRLTRTGERSFSVLDANDGSFLGEFTVDHNGALSRWRYGFGANAVEYIYGPLRDFGAIRAPSWGALSDGSFRFSYVDVRLVQRDEEVVFASGQ